MDDIYNINDVSNTRTLLTFVVGFSLFSKILRDLSVFTATVSYFYRLLFDIASLPTIIYLLKMLMFVLTMLNSSLIPIYFSKYICTHIRHRIVGFETNGADTGRNNIPFLQYMFRPQLYCVVIGLFQSMTSFFFDMVVNRA